MLKTRPSNKREGDNKDEPPMSRLFIICNKINTEDEVRKAFIKFGDIDEIWVVKDKATNENKGVVYVKFTKTSSAAKALEHMHGKMLGCGTKAIKVYVASNRDEGSGFRENIHEKYVRLFIFVPKEMSEEEVTNEFEKFGNLESVTIIKDKITNERKGFAFVKYSKFSNAALAYEGCKSKFNAVFAEPKSSSKRINQNEKSNDNSSRKTDKNETKSDLSIFPFTTNVVNTTVGTELNVICSVSINQDQLWRLFDIVPDLNYCQITDKCGILSNNALAVYNTPAAAAYAKEKLHGLEYPPGERLIVKPTTNKNSGNMQDGQDNQNSMELISSVQLPDPAPMANSASPCALRCFIVCSPKAPSHTRLVNIFSRFGNLIDVYTIGSKNCGYAKYASEYSANKAISTLNDVCISGVTFKVMEADEPSDSKRQRIDSRE